MASSDRALEFELKLKSTELAQDVEIDRILTAFDRDPFALLELDAFSRPASDAKLAAGERFPAPSDVKKAFRTKSLLLHPDKCQHPRAPDAFDLLKKAEAVLSDENKRKEMFGMLDEARGQVVAEKGAAIQLQGREKELAGLMRMRFRRLLEDTDNRAKILRSNEVDRKAKEQEEREAERKKKAEHDKQWELTRDDRVNSWRKFVQKGSGKKKPKPGPY
ncbi:hypothetical protein DFJ74DRAFT_208911 [Hyaloraphidium curvatum]|nr:hypothetical protein DFJ74DRAFT_208911 [Hyaloraphidium curvatum]